jgi:uncharacterized protein
MPTVFWRGVYHGAKAVGAWRPGYTSIHCTEGRQSPMAEIPLFPLPWIVFPGRRLALKIFESRYLDMVKRCLRDDAGFGIVLIEEGDEVLRNADQQLPAVFHCGTYAKIVDFDQNPDGTLAILVVGQVKFVIRDQYESADRLMMAEVDFQASEEEVPIPEEKQHLVSLLKLLIEHDDVAGRDLGVNFDGARDVSARLTELLPSIFQF